jgi:RHS repeat-associated protein
MTQRFTASATAIVRGLLGSLLIVLFAPSVARAQDEVVYYHIDAIGSVRATTDAAGAVIERYDYLPFGEPWAPPSSADVMRFAGKERDVETDLDYFGARYYRDVSGRFITVDPLLNLEAALIDPQQWNRYSYVRNSPLRMVDPDGREPVTATLAVMGGVGAAVYGSWNAYQNVRQGRPWYENIGVEASKGFLVGATLGLAAPALAGTTAAEIGVLTSTGATITGPLGAIARGDLDRAMNAGGQTVELVTKLTQSPAAGRALSAAGGEGAQALAAASRAAGNLYMARIPDHAIRMLQRAGLLEIRNTVMNGVRGVEYRFRAEAMDYLSRHFKEIK